MVFLLNQVFTLEIFFRAPISINSLAVFKNVLLSAYLSKFILSATI